MDWCITFQRFTLFFLEEIWEEWICTKWTNEEKIQKICDSIAVNLSFEAPFPCTDVSFDTQSLIGFTTSGVWVFNAGKQFLCDSQKLMLVTTSRNKKKRKQISFRRQHHVSFHHHLTSTVVCCCFCCSHIHESNKKFSYTNRFIWSSTCCYLLLTVLFVSTCGISEFNGTSGCTKKNSRSLHLPHMY